VGARFIGRSGKLLSPDKSGSHNIGLAWAITPVIRTGVAQLTDCCVIKKFCQVFFSSTGFRYISMLISANFESMPNVFVATLACAVFLFGYFNPLSYAGFARIRVLT